MPFLPLLTRGTVNSGALAGTIVADNNDNNKNISSRGRIIGIIAGSVILIIVIVIAVCYDRSKKRKAKQGTRLREIGGEEEARPMVYGQGGAAPRTSVQMPAGNGAGSGMYYPPQGEQMYPGGGYAQGPAPAPMYAPPGQQGAEFYRNQ
ncbi:hypothetical protein L207DRAFT_575687 [Hyaloscypha variabilis F]|uniref:Uncharacterized protein n=1 Tax=Hyaloscypha variabilis (strain UAMH 11265 / GT02V1 / F) TaxID=1149755 RepID=A0A2J6SE45_HYAVF|nr:hypothetical protein L207DRAFT_575687 [Hyaloscypha variabilis F]